VNRRLGHVGGTLLVLPHALDLHADAPGQGGEFQLGQVQDPVLPGEGGELLVLVGNSGRERGDMPVDMPVPRLAAQAHDVQPLSGKLPAERLTDLIHEALQVEVLLYSEVTGDLLAMGSGGDQSVTNQRVVPGEERNRVVIGPDEVAWVVGVAGKGLADEAGPLPGSPFVRCGVHGPARQGVRFARCEVVDHGCSSHCGEPILTIRALPR